MSVHFKLNEEFIQRLKSFINSEAYNSRSEISYSEYWLENASSMSIEFGKDNANIEGKSGFYIPQSILISRILKVIKNPFLIRKKLINKFQEYFEKPLFVDTNKAFDRAMSHHYSTDPDLSKYRVNHLKLVNQFANVLKNSKEVKNYHYKWAKEYPNSQIIIEYYLRNLLIPYLERKKDNIFLDIGSGNGNLVNLLTHEYSPKVYCLVDLPESLINAIIFLRKYYPKSLFFFPNEINSQEEITSIISSSSINETTKFVFLTPWQANYIPSNTFSFCSNITSFQEMTKEQVNIYFDLIERITIKDGLFLCVNRVEKIPVNSNAFHVEQTAEPIRFYEYPWRKRNLRLIDEISRLHRIVQADDIAIRLESIKD